MSTIVFDPPLRAHQRIIVSGSSSIESFLTGTLHLAAFELHRTTYDNQNPTPKQEPILQVWTNLPVVTQSSVSDCNNTDKDHFNPSEWRAHTFSRSEHSGPKRAGVQTCPLRYRLERSEQQEVMVFRYTYRLIWPDGNVEWLGNGGAGDDGIFTFQVDDQKKEIGQVNQEAEGEWKWLGIDEHVHVSWDEQEEKRERDRDDEQISTAILKFPVASDSDAQTQTVFDQRICTPSDRNVRGIVLERTKTTWHTSCSFSSLSSLSEQYEASLLVLLRSTNFGGQQVTVMLPLTTSTDHHEGKQEVSTTLIRSHDAQAIYAKSRVVGSGPGAGGSTMARVVVSIGPLADLHRILDAATGRAARFFAHHQQQGIGSSRLATGGGSGASTPTTKRVPSTDPRRPLRMGIGGRRIPSFVSSRGYVSESDAESTNSGFQAEEGTQLQVATQSPFLELPLRQRHDQDESTLAEYDDLIGDDTLLSSVPSDADADGDLDALKLHQDVRMPWISSAMNTAVPDAVTLAQDTTPGPLDPSTGLGLCTWETCGPGQPPLLSVVLRALHGIEETYGVGCVTSLLIDDGWARVDRNEDASRGRLCAWEMQESLLDVEEDCAEEVQADASVLQRYIAAVQACFPSVAHVGVWATLAGYWDGLSLTSSTDGNDWQQRYAPLAQLENRSYELHSGQAYGAQQVVVPGTLEAMQRFWHDACAQLASDGVAFIKVDNQAEWEWYRPSKEDGEMPHPMQLAACAWESIQQAAATFFPAAGGSVIQCMAFSPRLTNSALTLTKAGGSMTLRNSDDFFPHVAESHRWHILHNAYNSLLTSHLAPAGVRIDMDMVGRADPVHWTDAHVALRAFSNAKLWLSQTSADVHATQQETGAMRRLLAPAADATCGTAPALRTVQASRAVKLVTSADNFDMHASFLSPSETPAKSLKLAVAHPAGSVTLGMWNLNAGRVSSVDIVRHADLAQAVCDTSSVAQTAVAHAVYARSTGALHIVYLGGRSDSARCASDVVLPVTLAEAGVESIFLAPLASLEGSDGVQATCLGLIDRHIGLEAVIAPAETEDNLLESAVRVESISTLLPGTATETDTDTSSASGEIASSEFGRRIRKRQLYPTPRELLISYGPLVALRVVLLLVVAAMLEALLLNSPVQAALRSAEQTKHRVASSRPISFVLGAAGFCLEKTGLKNGQVQSCARNARDEDDEDEEHKDESQKSWVERQLLRQLYPEELDDSTLGLYLRRRVAAVTTSAIGATTSHSLRRAHEQAVITPRPRQEWIKVTCRVRFAGPIGFALVLPAKHITSPPAVRAFVDGTEINSNCVTLATPTPLQDGCRASTLAVIDLEANLAAGTVHQPKTSWYISLLVQA